MAETRASSRASTARFDLVDLIVAGAIGALVAGIAETSVPPEGDRRDRGSLRPAAIAGERVRAREQGRGRLALSPLAIPWEGWKDILWRVYAQIDKDRLLAVAGGVVFYGLLAVFPAITAFVSIYGLFGDVSTVGQHMLLLAQIVPAGAMAPIEEQLERLVSSGNAQLSLAFAVSLVIALWSANAGMKAVIDALNVAYDEEEKRGFVRLTLISFALTIGAIAAGLLAISAIVVLPVALSFVGFESGGETMVRVLRWPALLAVLILALAILYRFGPSRREPRWQWLSVGSVFAACTWLAGSSLFSLYLSSFADYNATYGSLGAAIGLMMWMWLSAIVILLGAELNAEIEHQTARDTTIGPDRPMGLRGAVVADTVGEAQG